MVDQVDPARRSKNMGRIQSKDTKPELLVRRAAHAAGFRFRLHSQSLPGKPDLVFPSRKLAIFVHGCFWHRHEGCKRSNLPKSNIDYWNAKLERNRLRDHRVQQELRDQGWGVEVVWECETRDLNELSQMLKERIAAYPKLLGRSGNAS